MERINKIILISCVYAGYICISFALFSMLRLGVKKGMEKYHVLVVEDDNEIANAIKIYLQNQGYDVYVGNDGFAGLEIV